MRVRITSELDGNRLRVLLLRLELKRLLRRTAGKDVELSVILVGEGRIRELNRLHRGFDEVTDVIAFPQMSPGELALERERDAPGPEPLGDIAICLPVAAREARERGESLGGELALLGLHGLLHLLGHEDDTEIGAGEMHRVEKELLGRTIIGEDTGGSAREGL